MPVSVTLTSCITLTHLAHEITAPAEIAKHMVAVHLVSGNIMYYISRSSA